MRSFGLKPNLSVAPPIGGNTLSPQVGHPLTCISAWFRRFSPASVSVGLAHKSSSVSVSLRSKAWARREAPSSPTLLARRSSTLRVWLRSKAASARR